MAQVTYDFCERTINYTLFSVAALTILVKNFDVQCNNLILTLFLYSTYLRKNFTSVA